MLSAITLAARPEFSVNVVTCFSDHAHPSEPEYCDERRLVLVHRGRFRRFADGSGADLDPTVGYLTAPGEEERFTHPAGGVCISICLTPSLLEESPIKARMLYLDAAMDLAHRRLLAATRSGDLDYAVTEDLHRLIARACGSSNHQHAPSDRALAEAAREAILNNVPESARLDSLAALLGVSPYRRSRAFSQAMGISITYYRNRVRVGWGMDRLAAGAASLADLAADLGFADQAHLTRTFRQHLGHTPMTLRRLLREGP